MLKADMCSGQEHSGDACNAVTAACVPKQTMPIGGHTLMLINRHTLMTIEIPVEKTSRRLTMLQLSPQIFSPGRLKDHDGVVGAKVGQDHPSLPAHAAARCKAAVPLSNTYNPGHVMSEASCSL